MAENIRRLRNEARTKWRWASGPFDERSADAVQDVAMAEPPPVPQKPKRVFEV